MGWAILVLSVVALWFIWEVLPLSWHRAFEWRQRFVGWVMRNDRR